MFIKYTPLKKTSVTISVQKNLQTNALYLLAAGFFLILSSHELSKSKVFQYSTGMGLFTCAGILFIAAYIFHKIIGKRTDGKVKVSSMSIIGFLALSGSYGASLIYGIRLKMDRFLMTHWEFALGYVVVLSLIGLGVTRGLRAQEYTKHFYTIVVKWCLRFAGCAALYNAYSSPLLSMLCVALLAVLYLVHWLVKFVIQGKKYKAEQAAKLEKKKKG